MKTIKATELTTRHRIMILEDVLQKLESGDTEGGLCTKIEDSAFYLLRVWDEAKNIIPVFTLENAKKITDVKMGAYDRTYWWEVIFWYDFKNRIKFVKWMINKEKEFLK